MTIHFLSEMTFNFPEAGLTDLLGLFLKSDLEGWVLPPAHAGVKT